LKRQHSLSDSKFCHWCGKAIVDDKVLLRAGKVFCCEGCYLGEMSAQNNQHATDEAYLALAESLAAALDAREHETGLHSKRVACHTLVLARQLTDDRDSLKQVYWGALLHDIGKIAIPDVILLKQGKLTHDEWQVMRTHPQRGYDIVAAIPFMQQAAQIILHHEERYDGKGYPAALSGEDIPWGARLFAVIDTLDAMTNDRVYRKAMSFDDAKEEIIKLSGQQFDPQAVTAFLAEEKTLKEMVEMKCFLEPDFGEMNHDKKHR